MLVRRLSRWAPALAKYPTLGLTRPHIGALTGGTSFGIPFAVLTGQTHRQPRGDGPATPTIAPRLKVGTRLVAVMVGLLNVMLIYLTVTG